MEIENAVVHELIKARNTKGASVKTSNAELVRDDRLASLVSKVLESYNNRCSRHAGSFKEDLENYRFSVTLKAFIEDTTDFLEFSKLAMERLRSKIESSMFASGGYLLFVRYHVGERDMLLVAKLTPESGAIFSADLHEVRESQYLNVDRLQVAARVDVNGWLVGDDDGRYLTFVLKKEEGHPSDYFQEFIGCEIEQDSRVESLKTVRVVKDFVAAKLQEQGLRDEDVADVHRRAFDYAESVRTCPDEKTMDFESLANAVWPDAPADFLSFLNQHADPPSAGFAPYKAAFKQLSGITYRSKEFSVKMTYDFKHDHVRTEGDRVIIEQAPKALIQELEG